MDRYLNKICKYCNKSVDIIYAESLICKICDQNVHLTCLKRESTPGGLSGDVFFTYICKECSETSIEIFERGKMTWFQVIILGLYHFQHKLSETANNGFYHWKIHIVNFIDKKWNLLFSKDFKRKKNWMGTVSGTISHFSPCFFTSGVKYLGEPGWWRLTFPELTPGFTVSLYNELISEKKINLKTENDLIHIKNFIKKYTPEILSCNHMKDVPLTKAIECLATEDLILDIEDDKFDDLALSFPNTSLKHSIEDVKQAFQNFFNTLSEEEQTSQSSNNSNTDLTTFSNKTTTDFYENWDLINNKKTEKQTTYNIYPLRKIEEQILLRYLSNLQPIDRKIKSLKRKLKVREILRNNKKSLLNIDAKFKPPLINLNDNKNRFAHYYNEEQYRLSINSYYIEKRIVVGNIIYKNFITSPYTCRLLKPYIRRNYDYKSKWLQLMHELISFVNKNSLNWIPPSISTLDYCYVRSEFIPCINSLCENYFWPGIDMTETLEYPDFSCVVLYKRLIVAFAFMVPDVKYNEAYISFVFTRPEWRRIGIAKFMIYHLTQTCLGKDITLHVAIDNPAIFLYQQFGFKVEAIIYNFYDTYLRDDCKNSRHAFFLKLER